ncbi:MAG: glycosyltransferase family 9 protein [Deltaproteobacteria bacterium]|nr:glycosyltransferase family 9 protein [Deltaproteobacteria bacterium]
MDDNDNKLHGREVIVLFELGALGDSIMTLPAMQAVRCAQPQAHIVRVHEKRMSEFFRGCPLADVFIAYDRSQAKQKAALNLLNNLRALNLASIANLHTPDFARPLRYYLRDSLFLLLSKAPQRLAWTHSIDNLLITDGIPRKFFGQQRIDQEILAVVQPLIKNTNIQTTAKVLYWLSDNERDATLHLYAQHATTAGIMADHPYFCVAPFARAPTREWSLSSMGQAVELIVKQTGLIPVILGAASDRSKLSSLLEQIHKPVVDLVGTSSIRDAATLMAKATFTLSVDTGLMHLSALMGTPVVAIFTAGNPVRWHPLPQAEIRIVAANCTCSPCYRFTCDDLCCHKEITTTIVAQAAIECYQQITSE